jgi:hypothetical protein
MRRFASRQVKKVVGFTLGFLLLLATLVMFLWVQPRRDLNQIQVKDKDYLEADSRIRSTVVTAVGGLAALTGLLINWRTALENKRIAIQNQLIVEQGQITSRFNDAIQHLGNSQAQVRVGGLYALGRILHDSQSASRVANSPSVDYWAIMDVIVAFLQAKASAGSREAENDRVPVDIQAALNVIGQRRYIFNRDYDAPIDLSGLDLRMVFLQDAHMEWAFLDNANFQYAWLKGTNFTGANFGRADLSDAILKEANLQSADLSSVVGLTQESLDSCIGNTETKIPTDLTRPRKWSESATPPQSN